MKPILTVPMAHFLALCMRGSIARWLYLSSDIIVHWTRSAGHPIQKSISPKRGTQNHHQPLGSPGTYVQSEQKIVLVLKMWPKASSWSPHWSDYPPVLYRNYRAVAGVSWKVRFGGCEWWAGRGRRWWSWVLQWGRPHKPCTGPRRLGSPNEFFLKRIYVLAIVNSTARGHGEGEG